jgi:CDP-diacylglycerol---glycerol-3-phosphate 3-phosphatidyltransferase
MNIPNSLTLARIVLVPVFLLALLTRIHTGGLIAAAVFIVAAITDGVDGYLARRNKEITRLGQFLDPLADKLLISAALVAMVELNLVTTWVAMVIIGREMAVTGLRAIAAAEGTVIAAGPWGKAKTVTQIIFVVTAILESALPQHFWLGTLARWLFTPMLVISVALTLYSGVDYFLAYVRGVRSGPPNRRPLKFRFKLPLRRKRSDP